MITLTPSACLREAERCDKLARIVVSQGICSTATAHGARDAARRLRALASEYRERAQRV